jgi:hypothetical protein
MSGMSAHSIIDQLIGTSVLFNGVLVPASGLAGALSRYVDSLIVWNEGQDVHRVSLVGSAVPIRFADHYFLLCTNHQLRGVELPKVSLLERDGRNLVTSGGMRQYNDEQHPLYRDLAAFDFIPICCALGPVNHWDLTQTV